MGRARMGKRVQGRGGQSTLEYILVLAAILVAVILMANSQIKPATENALKNSASVINSASNKLANGLGLGL